MIYPEKIQCKKCGEFKTHEHFYWNKKKNCLAQYCCKKCGNERTTKRDFLTRNNNHEIEVKLCKKCNKLFIAHGMNLKKKIYCSYSCYRNNRLKGKRKKIFNKSEINKRYKINHFDKCKIMANDYALRSRAELLNSYVSSKLKRTFELKDVSIPSELIELKRAQLRIVRFIKNKKQNEKDNECHRIDKQAS